MADLTGQTVGRSWASSGYAHRYYGDSSLPLLTGGLMLGQTPYCLGDPPMRGGVLVAVLTAATACFLLITSAPYPAH
jgi:hypothetical protein